MDEDVLYSTIPELGRLLTEHALTSRELTEAYLKRLRELGPRFNSVARLTEETALSQADAADRLFQQGRLEGPLQGIPFAVKDLLAARGYVTSWGSEVFRDQQFDFDATVVRKLAHARGVLAAKLAMVRFAGGGGYEHPTESLHGPGRNPWNPDYWAGGSSSGSGSAVAAAMVPFAIGSETWGSIVGPCSYCGVTGLRSTYGLVSRSGAMALSWTMDKLGPMCRSAEDCALVLEAISGPDGDDPSQSGRRFRADGPAPPASMLRVGYSEVDFEEWAHPDSRPALREALEVLRDTGAQMKPASLPEMPYRDVARTLISCEAASVFEDVIRSEAFEKHPDPSQKKGLRRGLGIPATDYLKAMRIRRVMQGKLAEFFEKVDIVVQPASAETAPLIEEVPGIRRSSNLKLADKGNTDLGAAGNVAGLPALTIPCGFGLNNLPTALQLVSRPHNEAALISLGKEFQKRTDWHRQRPLV
ncbi:MAG: amidase [Bryobacterales bacterium]|nr:amidase [Bryobacterales bacterium]MDE0295305.1 amidase [Bryobacterales bacterium]